MAAWEALLEMDSLDFETGVACSRHGKRSFRILCARKKGIPNSVLPLRLMMQEAMSKTCGLYPEVRLMVYVDDTKVHRKRTKKRVGRKNEVHFEHFERTVEKAKLALLQVMTANWESMTAMSTGFLTQ